MDNKQNRQFYWEVKNLMSKGFEKEPKNVSSNKSSLVDSVKNILEQKEPFKQKPIGTDINTIKGVGQVISSIQNKEKGYNTQCAAFTKNVDSNPFRQINEGWWDNLVAGIKEVGSLGSNVFGLNQPTEVSKEQSQQKARENRMRSATQRTMGQFDLEREAGSAMPSDEELQKEISGQKTTLGTPLTPDQMRVREIAGKLKRERGLEAAAADDVEAEEVGSSIVRGSGKEYGLKPDFVKEREAAATEEMGPPKSLAEPEEMGPPSSLATPPTPTGPSTASPTPTPAKDDELERRVAARIKARERTAARDRQEAKIQQARFAARDTSTMSPAARERQAEAMARLELRASGEDVTRQGLSDEDIRGQEQRALARERRTPEQKAADEAKNKAVVADLNKKAEEARQRESQTRVATGSKTPSASQTAPQSYRI